MTEIKKQKVGQVHLEAMHALLDALKPFQEELGTAGMIALVSHLGGQLVALLDANKYTPEMAMELVSNNFQLGNDDVTGSILNTQGSA